jgi:hypothetical protein
MITENLRAGDLAIDVVQAAPAGSLRLLWTGRSGDRNPHLILGPYFEQVLASAAAQRASLELRFEKLDHFNSSTVATIIQLIQDARQRDIKLAIVYDARLRWQKLSFDALRVFVAADGLLELRSVEEAP